ncbi:TIM barrel protein [Jiella sp. M17.18]|uniref:TIM barrel protein n=1 Tax=Jiella sp. M17.18 TaxID=3234247 RepID=UPI0034E043B3
MVAANPADAIAFGLNHMAAPKLSPAGFFGLARSLGIEAVEIRNDLAGNAILDGTAPEAIRDLAAERGVRIVSINALQRFNAWTEERAAEAIALADYAAACGAEALVLVPKNDGTGTGAEERLPNLMAALRALKPILAERGLTGLVEPLGFAVSSLRLKSEAVEAIASLDAGEVFELVHDTFHHHLAGEAAIFPEMTGLVHISGVSDPTVAVSRLRDDHRILVGADDRLGNLQQIDRLLAGGYRGVFSFEPFAAEVHALADPAAALSRSMAFIAAGLREEAA